MDATNPFVSANGPKWDNHDVQRDAAHPGSATVGSDDRLRTVTVTPNGLFSDCLSYSAIIFSTVVQDTDDDGLVDVLETTSGLDDPKA